MLFGFLTGSTCQTIQFGNKKYFDSNHYCFVSIYVNKNVINCMVAQLLALSESFRVKFTCYPCGALVFLPFTRTV